MKTYNLKITALILALTLSFAGQTFAGSVLSKADEKKVVKINMKASLVKFMANTLDISQDDINILKDQIDEANFFIVHSELPELEISLEESTESGSVFVIEYIKESPELEDWMFEDDYLSSEEYPVLEDWMYEDNYLSTENSPVIEDWMLEDNYYYTEAQPVIEDWMFDDDYLNTEAQVQIEDWMLDTDYFESSECIPEFEDWMFDGDYLSTESKPAMETWMSDLNYFN